MGKAITKFRGSNFNIGVEIGKILRNSGAKFDFNFIYIDFFKKQLEIYKNAYPSLLEQAEGIAQGGNFDKEKVKYSILIYSIAASIARSNGCTIMGVKNEAGLYIGRNYDVSKACRPDFSIYLAQSDEYPSHIGIEGTNGQSFLRPEDGINNHGLFVGLTYAHVGKGSCGLHPSHMVKLILETCTNVTEALGLFERVKIAIPKFFFLADANGNMAVVEHMCHFFRVLWPEKGVLVKTNHVSHPDLLENDLIWAKGLGYNSFARYIIAIRKAHFSFSSITLPDMIAILGDKGSCLCQNADFKTAYSIALDMVGKVYRLYWDLHGERKEMALGF